AQAAIVQASAKEAHPDLNEPGHQSTDGRVRLSLRAETRMNNGLQNLTPAGAGQVDTNTPLSNRRDWQFHAERINAAWGKQVASIIETGRYLIEAYDEMERASFEAMVQQKLAFGPSTARKLIVIAHHSILCAHVHKLPPSWGTLYELTKLPIEVL